MPFFLLFSGAFISLPALYISRSREPWHTLTLALGLALLVFGIGISTEVPHRLLCGVLVGAWLMLALLRCLFGRGMRNVENFAPVYMFTMIAIMCTVQVYRIQQRIAARAMMKTAAPRAP